MNMKTVENTVCELNDCSGCNACVNICPKKAIVIMDSIESYNAVINIDSVSIVAHAIRLALTMFRWISTCRCIGHKGGLRMALGKIVPLAESHQQLLSGLLKMVDLSHHAFLRTDNCYSCRGATQERISDITLGDAWGSFPIRYQEEYL